VSDNAEKRSETDIYVNTYVSSKGRNFKAPTRDFVSDARNVIAPELANIIAQCHKN
jgi:hypothetical protein